MRLNSVCEMDITLADCIRAHTNVRIRPTFCRELAMVDSCKALHIEKFPFICSKDLPRSRKFILHAFMAGTPAGITGRPSYKTRLYVKAETCSPEVFLRRNLWDNILSHKNNLHSIVTRKVYLTNQ